VPRIFFHENNGLVIFEAMPSNASMQKTKEIFTPWV